MEVIFSMKQLVYLMESEIKSLQNQLYESVESIVQTMDEGEEISDKWKGEICDLETCIWLKKKILQFLKDEVISEKDV